MTDAVKIALIVASPPTLVSIVTAWLGWLNRSKLGQVEERVDGRLTELLDLTRKSSKAEGVIEGKESK